MYLHSATYLNLVNAEFLVLAFFLVLSGWGSPLSCCCADTNTTYSMGTAALCCPFYGCWCRLFTLRLGSMPPKFSSLVYALCCRFYCCWCRLYTTARLNAAQILAVGVGIMVPILLLLEPPLHFGEGKCCPNFSRWCRRYGADFTAVGAASTLRRGSMLPKY